MSDINSEEFSRAVSIEATAQEQAAIPKWFGEVVLLSQIWIKTGLLSKLLECVKVARGRMGLYEVLDFVLLLLGYAVSEEKSLKFFFKIVKPFKTALAVLFNREQSPSGSALSRFLGSVSNEAVKALRKLLLEDLIEHGIKKEDMGGLYDRKANRHIVFDIDATKEVVGQRSLPKDAQYPPPSRRRGNCAPGYAGRKRGEAVRSYTTLQQSHSREWLGAFGAPGNGKIWEELSEACQLVVTYLEGREVSLEFGLLGLDGAYGWARGAWIVQQNSLGYLMRCSDYGLLDNVLVTQQLENGKGELFHQVDTGKSRQVIDVGFLNWSAGKDPSMSLRTRLIVACSEVAADGKVHTGKRIGNKVYELFATSVGIEQLRALDLISLYCGRGGFEQTLSEQDKELAPQRWCSGAGAGQDFWQLLSQWIWNARLRMGFIATTAQVRRTLWSSELNEANSEARIKSIVPSIKTEINSTNIDTEILSGIEKDKLENLCASNQNSDEAKKVETPTITTTSEITYIALATGRGSGKLAGSDFQLQANNTLQCRAGKTLKQVERHKESRRERIVYRAKASDCKKCLLEDKCRGADSKASRGRRVSVLIALTDEANLLNLDSTTLKDANIIKNEGLIATSKSLLPQAIGNKAVYWDDLPSTSLRAFIPNLLHYQQIEIQAPNQLSTPVAQSSLITRDRRAHRRLTWLERFQRNSSTLSSPWLFRIYGLPSSFDLYLTSIDRLAP